MPPKDDDLKILYERQQILDDEMCKLVDLMKSLKTGFNNHDDRLEAIEEKLETHKEVHFEADFEPGWD